MKPIATVAALMASAFAIFAAPNPQPVGPEYDTLSELFAKKPISGQDAHWYTLKGRAQIGDGFDGNFYWVAGSTAQTNQGTVFAWGNGRLIRSFTGPLDVRWFGATGNGVTDDTDAIQAAILACDGTHGVYLAPGKYVVNSLLCDNLPSLVGDGGPYTESTILVHKTGATNDMLRFVSPNYRPIISGFTMWGKKETNLRNMRTITSVADRYHFTINSAPPSGFTSGFVFFFIQDISGYHYLGSSGVASVSGTSVVLSADQDWFATPTAASGKLTTACVVCFSQPETEQSMTITDPSRAGYCAIDFKALGGFLTMKDIRIDGFHVGLRHGVAIAVDAHRVFSSRQNFAEIYYPFTAGADDRYESWEAGGNYAPQPGGTDTIIPLSDQDYRSTKYGFFLSGTDIYVGQAQLYHHIFEIFANYAFPLTIGSAQLDSSIREAIVTANGSSVSISKLVARGIGRLATETYSVILNVDSKLSVGQVYTDNANSIKASALVKNLSFSCENTFLDVQSTSGLASSGGFPVFEIKYSGLSQINYLRSGDFVVSGRGLSGASWVYSDANSVYGQQMAGDGTSLNPFRVELHSGGTNSVVNIANSSRVGINRIPTQNAFEVGGNASVDGAIIPYYLFIPRLEGGAIPGTNVNGAAWFFTTNSSGNDVLAVRYPNGQLVNYIDKDGNLTANAGVFTSLAAGTITSPLLSLTSLETGTLTSTNGLIQPIGSKVSLDTNNASYLQETAGGSVKLRSSTTGGGDGNIVLNVDGVTQFETGASVSGQFDGDSSAGNTRFLLWDVTAGSLKRVSVGANDSGGVGYKVLRVPN